MIALFDYDFEDKGHFYQDQGLHFLIFAGRTFYVGIAIRFSRNFHSLPKSGTSINPSLLSKLKKNLKTPTPDNSPTPTPTPNSFISTLLKTL